MRYGSDVSLSATRAAADVRKLIAALVVGAALIVLLFTQAQALIHFAQHVPLALDDPYTLNYGEGPLLDQAVRLARGENIYRADLSAPPYTITNYPPLYVLAQVPFVEQFRRGALVRAADLADQRAGGGAVSGADACRRSRRTGSRDSPPG